MFRTRFPMTRKLKSPAMYTPRSDLISSVSFVHPMLRRLSTLPRIPLLSLRLQTQRLVSTMGEQKVAQTYEKTDVGAVTNPLGEGGFIR